MFGHQDDQQILSQSVGGSDNQDSQWQDHQQDNVQPIIQAPADGQAAHLDSQRDDQTSAPVIQQTPLLEPTNPDSLLMIKQQALGQLQPLVSHLDQTPEERFHTTMMMIQASDDQTLIQSAFDAATQITDEKLKAQALLDIVNEINYFTHPQQEK